ncbi:hypothetical protein [Methylobacterium nonmethylotrophicum]|uniref:Uncharacterized protein n=1 Tax=Methylobacterium nonmethylotrophicum TaxID=1141884 RepID=A0A4Z0NFU8_9HYPH|nr:hypothetical protein [Methylobacterium nonmethylotrophicum]TGD94284.1 hypothetical protein EU555_32185 [Methylobacterium nonmethylotrophicum]
MDARARLRDGAGLLLLLLTPLLVVALPRSETVAVLGRPGGGARDAVAIVAAAGGTLLRAGGAGLVVARSDEAGFVRRLYGAGAWLVLDPAVAGGCDPVAMPKNPSPPSSPAR